MSRHTPIVRIKITELDTTTAARAEDSLDVVYVPGLCGVTYISLTEGVLPEGEEVSEDLVNEIFAKFCMGK